ncbi:MAG TPA: hypothetical protein GX692_09170 [Acholeplasmataceae bacterium]|jgi:glutamate racemase|nr:hypothetical protein [Acholeplasmataceae bacterium]
MVKDAIGIIDLGLDGIEVAETLTQNLKHERIIYITDLQYDSYLNISEKEIAEILKRNIEIIAEYNPKLLIIVNDIIVDRAASVILDLKVPSVNVIETLIEYANKYYQDKNMVLLVKEKILEANLFPKNLKYNRLYQIASDELEVIIKEGMTKTSRSFNTVLEKLKPVLKKQIDLIITGTPNLLELNIEFKEYLNFQEITAHGEIFLKRLLEANITDLNRKGRGGFFVFGNMTKKEFLKKQKITSKFKYQQIQFKE